MSFRRCASRFLFAWIAAALLAVAPSAEAGRRWQGRPEERPSAAPGNLGIADLHAYQISTGGASHRVLLRALVENQSPVDRERPWRLVVRGSGGDPLSTCAGDGLPRGRVAVCEMWLDGNPFDEGDRIEARLDRQWEDLAEWDGDPSNDRAETEYRTFPPGGAPLRIASWNVRPRILHGMGEVQFDFTVEGAHLVWLLVEGKPPRLLAGHPADGLVSGRGTERITSSGPVTLVARNSLGAFVYEAIPVLNSYRPRRPRWDDAGAAPSSDVVLAKVLEAGVYEIPADEIVLGRLSSYLAARDWAAALEHLRELDRQRSQPVPASALNPEGLER
ncbi:MAG: hypothetical protein D6718_10685 [Acidobacteria bacterium]|nr:MAG: hypothetical protein D6718_10685 [Acidobacteriota bacterium]